jgi:hypothetical protein
MRFRTSLKFATLILAAPLFQVASYGANLKGETVAGWQDYVQAVRAGMQNRTQPGGTFLWAHENSARLEKVQKGEIVVAPAPGSSPRKVPGGLIHHWIGAAFFQNVKLDNILQVTQDYDRYKEFYRPSVVASKSMPRTASDDRFSMLLMNRAFFLKTALDADYDVTSVRLADRRYYSFSTRSTRVQEIENYDQPGEHRMPEGEGGGYIWKLFSVIRLEEGDGGVYVEVEAMALSREIPGAVRFVIDPIVRRVSRNSVFTSIQQTEEAVRGNSLAKMKVPSVSAGPVQDTLATQRLLAAGCRRAQVNAFAPNRGLLPTH